MHWGRRKGTSTELSVSASHPHSISEDHIKKLTLKTKKLNQMSNAELKALNERMNLEKQYKDLAKGDISKGKKFVQNILDSAAKGAQDAAMEFVKKQAAKRIEDLIAKTTKAAK